MTIETAAEEITNSTKQSSGTLNKIKYQMKREREKYRDGWTAGRGLPASWTDSSWAHVLHKRVTQKRRNHVTSSSAWIVDGCASVIKTRTHTDTDTADKWNEKKKRTGTHASSFPSIYYIQQIPLGVIENLIFFQFFQFCFSPWVAQPRIQVGIESKKKKKTDSTKLSCQQLGASRWRKRRRGLTSHLKRAGLLSPRIFFPGAQGEVLSPKTLFVSLFSPLSKLFPFSPAAFMEWRISFLISPLSLFLGWPVVVVV